jgi:dephospho-CoA kinase
VLNVALTGNAAAGKSTVARWFQEWGATLIDADELVRQVERPGSPTLGEIVRRFGTGVLQPDGSLDRARLRQLVLEDPARRAALNAIVHPAVQARRAELVRQAAARGDRVVIHDIPLLFEVLDPNAFDLVLLVDAPDGVRRTRLRERGLSDREVDQLFAAQLPAAGKRPRSDIVLENLGSLEELKQAAWNAWETIKKRIAMA